MQMQNNAVGFRLSAQQNKLWSQQQINSAYCVQCAVELEGEVETAILRTVAETVVGAHEILRTTFHQTSKVRQPLQVINESAAAAFFWHELDLRHLAAPDRQPVLRQLLESEAEHNFDLVHGPLLRLCMVCLTESRHVLVVTQPAMCADNWSSLKLVNDLVRSYDASLRGESIFDEAPLQYVQYSEWQREIQDGEEAAAGHTYWTKQFSEAPVSALSFEKRPVRTDALENFSPARMKVATGALPGSVIAELTSQQKCGLEAFYLACWQALLARLTQRAEVVIAVECDGRRWAELEGTLGLFARSVPVRSSLVARTRFSDLLRATVEELSQARELQDYWSGPPETHPPTVGHYFPYGFVYEPNPIMPEAGRVKARLTESYSCVERFALRLKCIEAADGNILCDLHYDQSLFERADVERLAGQFTEIAGNAARGSAQLVSELGVITREEREHRRRQLHRAVGICRLRLSQRFAG
jgi:hypothetical protein